ncbi:MAG: AAA domain-containing protein [Egibacteraceae bacterium]
MREHEQPGALDDRRRIVEKAAESWKRELLRSTGRNNLLSYKDHRWATLRLDENAEAAAVGSLLRGQTVRLAQLFPEDQARDKAAGCVRAILKRARQAREEQGIETLFLALGLATWEVKDRANPCAPILLHPVGVKPRGSGERTFNLALCDEPTVNPLLVHRLREDFGLDVPAAEMLRPIITAEGGIGIDPGGLSAVYSALEERAGDVAGFATQARIVLSTFSYENLSMVRDLEEHLDAFVDHDLVAAVAGVTEARKQFQGSIAVKPEELDELPASDEYLVLDADSSQASLIAAARRGQSLVIQGPPGTGKSQTIANLLASAVADGKTVLFVAQKRAAIDAVLDRLKKVGLGDIVLDLHSRGDSGKSLAKELDKTLQQVSETPPPGQEEVAQTLQARRDQLNAYAAALHMPRQPWDRSLFQVRTELMSFLPPAQMSHRWSGAALKRLDAEGYQQASELLREYVQARGLEVLRDSPWANTDVRTKEHVQETRARLHQLHDRAWPKLRLGLDDLSRVAALSPATLEDWGETLDLLTQLKDVEASFSDGLWETDLSDLSDVLSPASRGSLPTVWSLLSSSRYRRARKQARGLVVEGGGSTQDLASSIQSAAQVVAWWRASHDTSPPSLPELPTLCQTYDEVREQLAALQEILDLDLLKLSPEQTQEWLGRLAADLHTLRTLPMLRELEDRLRAADLWDLVDELQRREIESDQARAALEYAWLASVRDWILSDEPRLDAFYGQAHDATVTEFAEADRRHLRRNQHRVLYRQAQRAHEARQQFEDEALFVRDLARKRSSRVSIRALLERAPNLVIELRPCWTMSPLEVARWLPATGGLFDLVVFDEASQVKPADAAGAILRGAQVVVAGDSHQLPPSNWFVGHLPEDDDEEEEAAVGTAGHESILTVLGGFLHEADLRWHYRSRDERLIAVANDRVYGNKLVTFPGALAEDVLRHVYVEASPDRTGVTASSQAEVERVVELILQHVRSHPNQSLGVITMSDRHLDRIEGLLSRTRGEHPDLDAWLAENDGSGFFLKNLERVQGDERDAIILSMGYQLQLNGTLRHNFGPLNQDGGERRLNVAITRARERMTVVSAFSFRHIKPDQPKGVRLLQDFLRFAECGDSALEERGTTHRPLNKFEQEVLDALEAKGIPVQAQYGVSNSTIDFVAAHRKRPGEMVLAIECDGDAYHRRPTARERDRLRQAHLETLGWRFHRLWSSDWFRDQERTVMGVMQAWQEACDATDGNQPGPPASIGGHPAEQEETPQPVRAGLRPSVPYKRPINEYRHNDLVRLAQWIDSDNRLRTEEELAEVLFQDLRFSRHGSEIMKRLRAAVAEARGNPARIARHA